MLILFDIDGTLLRSRGAGMRCMEAAGAEIFGRPFPSDGVDFGGALDPHIYLQLCERHGLPEGAGELPRFRAAYARRLAGVLGGGAGSAHGTSGSAIAWPLPGVPALLDALHGRPELTVGLLTGNWPETGALKLAAAGLPVERFVVNAWGEDGARRPDLLPVALARYAERHGRELPARRVVVVGDTPRDVEVARTHGARALAVATGHHKAEALAAAGADLVVQDLSETERLLEWLTA